jgi:nicotinate-nucleotide adenylyltransferase
MKIGLLGGSFNPPHIGHILVAQQVLDFTDLDEIWFLPAYKHTFDKPLAPIASRLAMVTLLKVKNTRLSTLESDYKLDGNTINLLPILKKEYKDDSFTFIIGSDQLPTFHKWGSWEKLLTQQKFLVVERAGYPLIPLYKGMQVLKNPAFITTNISSSMVRHRVKKNLSIEYLVPPTIATYIKKHNLYR